MSSLTHGPTTVELPDDLYWADETSWHPVLQTTERTLTGALVVQTHQRLGGRPITLQQPPGGRGGWLTRASVDGLVAWCAVPDLVMTLVLRGVARQVMWRHHEAPAFDAAPVMHYADVQSGDYYTATLRLMEI